MIHVNDLPEKGYYLYFVCACGQLSAVPVMDNDAFTTVYSCLCSRRWRICKVERDGGEIIVMRRVDIFDEITANEPARVEPAVYKRLE